MLCILYTASSMLNIPFSSTLGVKGLCRERERQGEHDDKIDYPLHCKNQRANSDRGVKWRGMGAKMVDKIRQFNPISKVNGRIYQTASPLMIHGTQIHGREFRVLADYIGMENRKM